MNYSKVADKIVDFISQQVTDAGARGVIFGLSGGIDSSVIAHLAKKAVGVNNCLALIMPNEDFTPDSETCDGLLVAKKLGIKYKKIAINKISDTAVTVAGEDDDPIDNMVYDPKKAIGNLNARIRAMLLYFEAQKNNYLVVGTDDKSEYFIGYFTKYGDGASDMLPIANLYKTQVQQLGKFLGVPSHIVEKSPSPHLWKNHKASEELGISYDIIDKILYYVLEQQSSSPQTDVAKPDTINRISQQLGVPSDAVKRIITLYKTSEHKRHLPPMAKL